jgi:hypothetical protein
MKNSGSTPEEKRGTPRVQKLYMIAYLPKAGDAPRTPISLGRTVDLSPCGVGMEIYQEVAVGTAIEMEINFEPLPIPAFGKVVRVDPLENGNFLVGISFDKPQELLETRISLTEMAELLKKKEQLEKALSDLVREAWPWDENGRPTEIMRCGKDGLADAVLAAKELLDQTAQNVAERKVPGS